MMTVGEQILESILPAWRAALPPSVSQAYFAGFIRRHRAEIARRLAEALAPTARPFVVHKHVGPDREHYDLRLELDGTLKSWAVPRGPSKKMNERRLAVQVEDHPLSYLEFEGEIPAGNYGAGTLTIWDRGTWSADGEVARDLERGVLSVDFDGRELRGRYSLVRSDAQPKKWLLIKGDRPVDHGPPLDAEMLEIALAGAGLSWRHATHAYFAVADDEGVIEWGGFQDDPIQPRVGRRSVIKRFHSAADLLDALRQAGHEESLRASLLGRGLTVEEWQRLELGSLPVTAAEFSAYNDLYARNQENPALGHFAMMRWAERRIRKLVKANPRLAGKLEADYIKLRAEGLLLGHAGWSALALLLPRPTLAIKSAQSVVMVHAHDEDSIQPGLADASAELREAVRAAHQRVAELWAELGQGDPAALGPKLWRKVDALRPKDPARVVCRRCGARLLEPMRHHAIGSVECPAGADECVAVEADQEEERGSKESA